MSFNFLQYLNVLTLTILTLTCVTHPFSNMFSLLCLKLVRLGGSELTDYG